jgi:hypothetical protein
MIEDPKNPGELAFDPVPSLQAVVAANGLDPENLTVGVQMIGNEMRISEKHSVYVTDSVKAAKWEVPDLAGLFRGNAVPPPDMDHYPPEYSQHFYFIEHHLLTLCDASKELTDQEMEDIYSALRRRPDGRSLGSNHDYMWQVAALLLGSYTISAAEYTAMFAALVASARRWGLRPVSRNYLSYLRETFSNMD